MLYPYLLYMNYISIKLEDIKSGGKKETQTSKPKWKASALTKVNNVTQHWWEQEVSGPLETRPVGRGTGTGRWGLTGAFQQQVSKRRVSTGAPGLGNPASGNLVTLKIGKVCLSTRRPCRHCKWQWGCRSGCAERTHEGVDCRDGMASYSQDQEAPF